MLVTRYKQKSYVYNTVPSHIQKSDHNNEKTMMTRKWKDSKTFIKFLTVPDDQTTSPLPNPMTVEALEATSSALRHHALDCSY